MTKKDSEKLLRHSLKVFRKHLQKAIKFSWSVLELLKLKQEKPG